MTLFPSMLADYGDHSFSIYLSAVCGLLMVLGSIALLMMGTIKLAEAGQSEGGLTVEIENKIKLSTRYPALGLFIIGLLFVALAVFNSQPQEIRPISIYGKVAIDDPNQLKVDIKPNMPVPVVKPNSDGTLEMDFRPEFQQLSVSVTAPEGYTPTTYNYNVTVSDKSQARFPLPANIRFTKANASEPIAPAPAGITLPPFVPVAQSQASP